MEVYEVLYERDSVGIYSTREKAVEKIAKDKKISVEEAVEGLRTRWNGYGYPDIEVLTLDKEIIRDR